MNYPLISEYVEAIKAAEDNFDQLKHLRPVLGEDGEPVMTSGNFAVVFKMKDEQTGKLHAVKCFLKEQEGRAEAYRQIAEELEFVSSTFLTPIKYLDKELFVDSANSEDSEFPVLLMDWVEGQTLDKYIREHIDDQYELSLLAYQFSRLAMWLMPQPFAHGDLKPDNILVKEDGTLVLVDYDGMYVPAMKGQKARELGSPDFRHPGRTEEVFDEHIDDFSLASILLSLKAIALQPSLLEEYGASDRLLFSEQDYRNLSESSALGALKPLMQDAELASLYSLYILALSQNNLSGVSFRLFNLRKPRMTSPNISGKSITKKEILASFQGKKNVIHYVNRDGSDIWIAGKQRFLDEVKSKGGSRINIIENDKEHVIYLYDVNDNEVGKYYIVEELRGKAPKTISEIKDNVIVLEVWINSMKKWFWGIGIEKHISKEILPSFQGKEKVWHIVDSNGKSSYMTQSWSFDDEVYAKGACKLNIVENDRKHVLFLFNDRNEEVGRYYIGKKIQGLTPKQMTEIKNELCFFESWNPETKTWVPCIGKIKVKDEDKEYIEKYGKTKSEYLKENFNEVNTLTAVCLKNVYDYYQHEDYSELEVGKIYQVTHIGVFRSYTKIMLNGFGNKQYNSTCFEIYENGESINKTFAKDPRFEAPYLREKYKRHHLELSKDSIEQKNLSTTVTDEDLANAWTDEYGAKYSADKKRLLKVPHEIIDNSKRLPTILYEYSIKEGTEIICDSAFERCAGLTKINIPNGVSYIGKYAFWCCQGIESLALPDSLTEIGQGAFYECIRLKALELSDNIRMIGHSAFELCTNLKSIIIPDSVIKLENCVFQNCYKLHSVTLPVGIKNIGDASFSSCYNLDEIVIPSNVVSIGANAFLHCRRLKKIWLSEDLTYIDPSTFIGCTKLECIYIPNNTFGRFEKLLPEFREVLMEEVTIENHKGHRRLFSKKELEAVNRAKVVQGQYTKLVCFYMNDGCQKYIPLCKQSPLSIGDEVDLNKAKLIELSGEGIYYGYIDGREYYNINLVDA